jgi:hypothetical protein
MMQKGHASGFQDSRELLEISAHNRLVNVHKRIVTENEIDGAVFDKSERTPVIFNERYMRIIGKSLLAGFDALR